MRDVIVALTASCESTLGKDMWNTLPFFNVDCMNAEAVHEVIDDIGKNNPMLNVPTVEVGETVEAIQATPGAQQLNATPEQIGLNGVSKCCENNYPHHLIHNSSTCYRHPTAPLPPRANA